MKCFVTGASGFIGSHVVRELLARGHQVKALLRPGSDEHGLSGLEFERVRGDILDCRLLEQEIAGCDWCFHVAAVYRLWMRDYAPMYEVNVAGSRNVFKAACQAGCEKIIYTSTVGCIGLPEKVDGRIIPATEARTITDDQLMCPYKWSKLQAESLALGLSREQHFPIVIVNPSAPIGPGDAKPTPTGKVIVDFLNRRMPAYLDTGLNWVHVRDVAIGHILAAEKGRPGERYILGSATGNWTLRETFAALEEISGMRAPRLKAPYSLALLMAAISESVAHFTGRAPQATMAGVRMARHKMWFDPGKAIRELGLPQTSPKQAFADAVGWYRTNGYAPPIK